MQLFSHDLGVDLGTSNVLINVSEKGIVVREPSVVAVDRNSGKILKVGAAARNMLGRTPGNVVAMHPLKNGVISDHGMTVKLLQTLFQTAARPSRFKKGLIGKLSKFAIFTPKPRVIISVPSGITEVEERSVINAAIEAGARRVYLIEEPLAAALGAGLNISGPNGNMVIDIGGGTTDVAVLTMSSVAYSASTHTAGITFDEAIIRYIRGQYKVIIGQATAEDLKIQIGCVAPRPQNISMKIKGRDVKTGRPKELTISASELVKPLLDALEDIADTVMSVMENTSPELISDIAENGITLTGGCSQLYGMTQYMTALTGIRCTVADDAASCVAFGCGKSRAWMNHMPDGPINIAKNRILRR